MTINQGRVGICTDTTACLSPETLEVHRIENVPQVVLFGEDSYLEEVEITYPEFIRRLKASPELPKTAAPPPGEFVKAYSRLFERADTVLSIHPSAEVSGTVRSAMTAREESYPDADIRIIDTRSVGGNTAASVVCAAEWAEQGCSADEIEHRIRELIPRGRTYFVVATLEYLRRGGRIGGASHLIGSALQIKPLLHLQDGRVEVLEKVRTQQRALARLRELVADECPRSPEAHLCVMHADDLAGAEELACDLQAALGIGHIPIMHLGAAITTHGGPGTLGACFHAGA